MAYVTELQLLGPDVAVLASDSKHEEELLSSSDDAEDDIAAGFDLHCFLGSDAPSGLRQQ